MIEKLTAKAELQAEKAEALPAFSGLKLLHVKRELEILLGLIGRDGIFDEYTRHDISHIDAMLKMLEWLVPDATKSIMSPADWLMMVSAIYFHDLGMLVTRQEYEARDSSGFPEYRETVLFAGDAGTDYRAKVQKLAPDKAERFLYQEFVRHKHAARIRAWILGQAHDHLGITHEAMTAVDRLLSSLSSQFRRDLALVCESHHLDDLGNLAKYEVSKPYGNSDEETANLQYAAVLLRATDLLHITSERTPSTAFRTISPSDPLSQEEWAKQMAVTRVRSQVGRDREGKPDSKAPRDTIEVHAYFTKPDGFFGLTSYLLYAQDQVRKCNEWVEGAKRDTVVPHQFPWRHVDDTNIQTQGFLRNQFQFTIDQARILDLLTGHTLYNDTRVVLRELVQNALDAVRLQHLIDKRANPDAKIGRVRIDWDSSARILSVQDTGTGMTQRIIENHLLNIGASRYQDVQFKKEYPDFSPISRFGIGVLSTFMIADTIEIFTCHPDDEQARHLSLRSVHGKYLIQLLDKQTDETAKRLAPHGTLIKLEVRPSAVAPDVVDTAQRWVVVPGCEVSVTVDSGPPTQIGFRSPREALLDLLRKRGEAVDERLDNGGGPRVRVEERESHNVTVAYAVRWSPYFQEWSFAPLPDGEEETERLLGICLEGIRVDSDTPGYRGHEIAAIANARGPSAPKTNVTRSGLEATPELDAVLAAIYSIYCAHVSEETQQLQQTRGFSLTWATQECSYLLRSLLGTRYEGFEPLNSHILLEQLKQVPFLLVERTGQRRAESPAEFSKEPAFWTIDCEFLRSADLLIREVQSDASWSKLVSVLCPHGFELPYEPVLCELPTLGLLEEQALGDKEVGSIRIYPDLRRIDLRWVEPTDPPRWRRLGRDISDELERGLSLGRFLVGRPQVDVSGIRDEIAAESWGYTFILPGNPVSDYLLAQPDRPSSEVQRSLILLSHLIVMFAVRHGGRIMNARGFAQGRLRRLEATPIGSSLLERMTKVFYEQQDSAQIRELYDLVERSSWQSFSTSRWRRRRED
jgi:molecular chaperone HtpG